MMDDERGAATPQMLLILLFGAAALAGIVLVASASFRYEDLSLRRERERRDLRSSLSPVLDALADDESPASDWLGDAVWASLDAVPQGVTLSLEDISSRINPNFVDPSLLEGTELRSMLQSGVDGAALKQFRADNGLSLVLDSYAAIFRPEALPSLSVYGWANVNVSDASALLALCKTLSDSSESAKRLSERLAGLPAAPLSAGNLATVFGSDAGLLDPVVNAEPLMNVHFVEESVLKGILSYPPFAIDDAEAKTRTLIDERETKELSADDIVAVLGVQKDHPVMQYLGTTTWFWKLTAASSGARYSLIVARLPSPQDGEEGSVPEFRIVERESSR